MRKTECGSPSSSLGIRLAILIAWGGLPVVAQESSPTDRIASRVPQAETGSEADHLTGDWGGWRTKLVEHGLHFKMGYTGEVLGNVSGGLRRGAIYEGLLEMGLELDVEKLGGWHGGEFRVTSLYPHGESLSRNYVGDLLTISNIDAYDSFRLYDLWFDQKFCGDHLSLRVGQMRADDEFAGTELGGTFLNSAFGWPAFVSANTVNTGPAFFVATPGVRLRYDISSQWYAQVGLYDGDSFDSPDGNPRVNLDGTHIHLSDQQGYFSMAEAGYKLNQGEGAQGLPGTYKMGAWLHTGDFPDNYRDESGNSVIVSGLPAEEHERTFGAYLALEQTLWREPGEKSGEQGLGVFYRVGGSPPDRAVFDWVMDGGVSHTGLIPGRDEDVLALGVVYARISEDIRRQQIEDRDINGTPYAAIADHETVIEVTYRMKIKPWWIIQPDAQYVLHPGGSGAIPDAFTLGVRTSIIF